MKLTNYSNPIPVLPCLNSPLTPMRYGWPIFKAIKSRVRTVKDIPQAPEEVARSGLNPCLSEVCAFTLPQLSRRSVSSLAVLNAGARGSTPKGPEGRYSRQGSGNVIYNSVSLTYHPKLRNRTHGVLFEGHEVHQSVRPSQVQTIGRLRALLAPVILL